MISLNFNKNSWHYKIAKFGGLESYDDATNFCHYTRRFFLGILLGLFVCQLAAVVAISIGDMIGLILALITTLALIEPTVFAIIGISITGAAAVLTSMMGYTMYSNHRESQRVEAIQAATLKGEVYKAPEPGFVVTLWRKFHEKTCFKVQLN